MTRTREHATTLMASNRAELEKKIVNHFSLGFKATTDVTKSESGKYQIELIN